MPLTFCAFHEMFAYMIGKAISLKLSTDAAQAVALTNLATAFAKASNALVPIVVANRCWNRVALHHLGYHQTRAAVPELGSQMVCQAVRRVADAYKVIKPRKGEDVKAITFKPTSVNYDCRTHWIKGEKASLYTLSGRIVVDIQMGKRQRDVINQGKLKESILVKRNGAWYLNAFVELPSVPPKEGGETMGVDVGENNLAVTSTGKIFGGGELRHKRDMHLACRKRLQANGSRAAKRKLKAISGRESRHVKHVNHEVSKAIVAEAIQIGATTIKLEDLTHIRANIKAGKRVKTRLHRWAFRQLQDFVVYKAQHVGIETMFVNPAYTSKTCSVCGEIGSRNRHRFSCGNCGTMAHSDCNAAANIAKVAKPVGLARGGKVTRPKFAQCESRIAVESHSL